MSTWLASLDLFSHRDVMDLSMAMGLLHSWDALIQELPFSSMQRSVRSTPRTCLGWMTVLSCKFHLWLACFWLHIQCTQPWGKWAALSGLVLLANTFKWFVKTGILRSAQRHLARAIGNTVCAVSVTTSTAPKTSSLALSSSGLGSRVEASLQVQKPVVGRTRTVNSFSLEAC